MQDEVNEKVVALSIKTSKLTAEVLQKAMKAVLTYIKNWGKVAYRNGNAILPQQRSYLRYHRQHRI